MTVPVPAARRLRHDIVAALAVVPPAIAFTLAELKIAGELGLPLDDSWIHLHFARNLAEGAGFSYNPGVPVAGSTAPLWTLLLAAATLAAGASAVTAKVVGIAMVAAAAVVTRRASIAWGAPPAVATAAAVTLAWLPAMTWGALSGMEVGLAALLVAGALLALAHDAPAWTALLGALAVLARPEALLLVPFLALARPPRMRRLVIFALVVVAVLAPVVAFSLATVGRPVPATAVAKVEGGLLGWVSGIGEPAWQTWVARPSGFVRDWVGWLVRTHWLLAPVAVAGAVVASRGAARPLTVVSLGLLAHPLGMALLAPYRGPAFQEGRYSIHLLPVAVVAIAVGVWPRAPRPRRLATGVALALALVALVPAADRYAWSVQNINAMQVQLGRWLARHVPPTAALAVNDIGAIAFFSRRHVIDLMGLVTPEILEYRREGEAGVHRFVRERCPDYVVIFPAWFPRLAADERLLAPVHRIRLDRVEVSGGPEMVVYRLRTCAV